MDNDFTICTRHSFCEENLNKIIKLLNSPLGYSYQDTIDRDYEILNLVKDTISEIKLAKKSGKRMEARLKKYRKSIESLGFIKKVK